MKGCKISRSLRPLVLLALGWLAAASWASPTPTLELWIGSDKGFNGAAEIGRRYQLATQRRVIVRHFDDLPAAFEEAAATGRGPDVLIWAHDRYGEWAQQGLIVPVQPSARFRQRVAPFTWSAVRIGSQLYGYPIAVEAVGLIYNRQLVAQPPTDFEQLFALAPRLREQGVAPIAWDYSNTYFSWGLLSANGGYAFRQTPNGFDPNDSGVDNPGAVTGARLLQRLLAQRVLAPELTGQQALDAFANGRVAMIINGPWVWRQLSSAGVEFGVAPLPAVQGGFAKPFVGVWAAAITRFAQHPQWAAEFLEDYLLSNAGLKLLNGDKFLGPVANRALMGELAADPRVDQAFLAAVRGEMMPNLPQMGRFWRAMESALAQITHQGAAPKAALREARLAILGADE